jgi:serine/threonine protein kinase
MHRCGIVNLDISLENILCEGTVNTPDFRVVLTDLGHAELLPVPTHQYPLGVVKYFGRRGKKYYYAPEYDIPNVVLSAMSIDAWQLVRKSDYIYLKYYIQVYF